jgi:hypothetical protein
MLEVAIQIVSARRNMTFRQLVQIHNAAQSEMVITRELLKLVKSHHVLSGDHINIIPIQPEVGFDDV